MSDFKIISLLLLTITLFASMAGAAESYPFQQHQGYIIALTDIHIGIGDDASQKLVDHFLGLEVPPRYIFVGGDLTEMGSDYEFSRLKEYYQPLEDRIPIGWMMGNHDARWSTKGFYLFEKELGPEYFAIDFDKFVFIGLNSATLLEQHGHIGKAQYDWLKKKLESIGNSKPVIMQLHHPFGGPSQFTDDGYRVMNLIRRYNIPLILYGHGHSYNFAGSYNHAWIQMLDAGMNQYYTPISWDDDYLYIWKAHPEEKTELIKKIPLYREKKASLEWAGEPVYNQKNNTLSVTLKTKEIKEIKLIFTDKVKILTLDGPGVQKINWQLDQKLKGKGLLTVEARGEDTTLILSREVEGEMEAIKWVFPTGDSLFTQPVINKGYLYFGNQEGKFFKLKAETGEVIWEYKAQDAIFASPVFYHDMVIFAATDRYVYALDKKEGKLVWKKELSGIVYNGLVAGKEMIAVGTGDMKIYGLDPKSGKIKWNQYGWGMIQSKGAYDNGHFIFTSWGGVIQVIDELNGESLEAYSSGGGYSTPGPSRPVIYKDTLFYTNTGSRYCGQSLSNKDNKWEIRGPRVGYATVDISDGYGFLSTLDGEVFKFKPENGEKVWTAKIPQPIFDSSPQCFKDYLAVGTIDGDVWILRQQDGSIVRHISLGNGFIFGKIRAIEDTLYVGSMDGNLYAVDVSELD